VNFVALVLSRYIKMKIYFEGVFFGVDVARLTNFQLLRNPKVHYHVKGTKL